MTIERLPSGVAEVTYWGVLTCAALDALRLVLVKEAAQEASLIVRLDKVLYGFACAPPVPVGAYPCNSAPAALVVQPENYDMWTDYARNLAAHGVMRAVFLSSELVQAEQWAVSVVCVDSASPLPERRTRPGSHLSRRASNQKFELLL